MHRSQSVLTKDEVMVIMANALLNNHVNSINSLKENVKQVLRKRGIIGPVSESRGGGTVHYDRRISNEDALLINECVYDLLYGRVITPGMDEANLDLPWIHVSNVKKLRTYL
ncbi:hypothetical protein P4502_12380 [Peribacillus frigoritolerans]|uniref:hypothetical protein n=1 Tax=Peribacillus frigoritolerans TaxID=450367 RepID=UPI002E2356E7|nr:hypothetical protein [Peribacillus frigoritolerans]